MLCVTFNYHVTDGSSSTLVYLTMGKHINMSLRLKGNPSRMLVNSFGYDCVSLLPGLGHRYLLSHQIPMARLKGIAHPGYWGILSD